MAGSRNVLSLLVATVLYSTLSTAGSAWGADWPAYRHDNARSGITDATIETPLVPLWTFVPPVGPAPAWTIPVSEAPRVRFDDTFHVVVAGSRAFFGSSGDNKVYALDTDTGAILWSFFTDGPVRLAPTISEGLVYFGSDDGFAYCLKAETGEVVWKRRAADRPDRVIGHQRIISLWPVRSGVLVDDGVAYFTGGIFPSESIFVNAVDAKTGETIWRNDTTGEFGPQQRFDGISPQGYLLVSKDLLYVPAGRSLPAAFNRKDGKFKFYLSPSGKVGGAYALLIEDNLVAASGAGEIFESETGARAKGNYAWAPANQLIVDGKISYTLGDKELVALDRDKYADCNRRRGVVQGKQNKIRAQTREIFRKRYYLQRDDPEKTEEAEKLTAELATLAEQLEVLAKEQREIEDDAFNWRREGRTRNVMVVTDNVVVTGGDEQVDVVDRASGAWRWSGRVDGKAVGLAVADGKLFVSTTKGTIHCFAQGTPANAASLVGPEKDPQPFPEDGLTAYYGRAAERIVAESGADRGFCLVLGCGDGRLALELAKRTNLNIYCIDDDARAVARARAAIDAAGLYGKRITVDHGSLEVLPYPSYFANLIVSDRVLTGGRVEASAEELYRVLRPTGGVAMLGQPSHRPEGTEMLEVEQVQRWLSTVPEATPELTTDDGTWVTVTRAPLPGAGNWTHQYANPGNTSNSGDKRIKPPLSVLWFGRPGPARMVERHGRAAAPVSYDGRLFVQGENVVMAYDAYNGAELWTREIPGAVRVRVDVDGSNMAATERGLFLAVRDKALRLDAATGKTLAEYSLPAAPDGSRRRWGVLYCVGDTLVGSTTLPLAEEYGVRWQNPSDDPIENSKAKRSFKAGGQHWRYMQAWPDWGREDTWRGALTQRLLASDAIFAVDIKTGEQRWSYRGKIANTALAIGDGQVFLADHNVTEDERAAAVVTRRDKYGLLKGEYPEKDDAKQASLYDVRKMVSLDLNTGNATWQRPVDLTGSGGEKLGMVYDGTNKLLMIFGNFSNHDGSQFSKGGLSWRRVTVLAGSDGSGVWSKALNYLRRPFILGTQLIVEPRSVDLATGNYKMRYHPITGKEVFWEFKRGGHSCGVCSASDDTFFFRSESINYFDVNRDSGMLPLGATRAGCWINMIPCNGLTLLPEASAGCNCSFPIRSTLCLAPKENGRTWSIFASPGSLIPVRHLFINFGAPGDRTDADGNVWFNYPRLKVGYGIRLDFQDGKSQSDGFYAHSFEAAPIAGTDQPWIFSSGAKGPVRFQIPLLEEGSDSAKFTVRLGFCEPKHAEAGQRQFDIKLQGKTVAERFDIVEQAGGQNVAFIAEFSDIDVTKDLDLELVAHGAGEDAQPLLNSIEVVR